MKIRPKHNIYKFLNGSVPTWYSELFQYPELVGWNPNLRNDYANDNLRNNGHGIAGDLSERFSRMNKYTSDKNLVTLDIQSFYNNYGLNMTAELFRDYYNGEAAKVRGFWNLERRYNTRGNNVTDHNERFRRMFTNRSNQNNTADYNIGYLENLADVLGSSTNLRDMDRYETKFNGTDANRIHEIKLSNGATVKFYKKLNGDIEIFNGKPETTQTTPNLHPGIPDGPTKPTIPDKITIGSSITGDPKNDNEDLKLSWWNTLSKGIKSYAPDILEAGRLVGNLNNNERVYLATKKGIVPNYIDTYNTYARIQGDEGTRQIYYKRAALGELQAAKPVTSDLDKLMAYRFEAKRVGDELREKGDLADNAEIRRTSDISNQHSWQNIARANLVANANSAERGRVIGALANLEAQKYSADWTNLDNYLTGIEYRWRDKLNEYKAATKLKNLILFENALDNDYTILDIQNLINEEYKNNGRVINQKIRNLQKLLENRKRELQLEWYDPVTLGDDYVLSAKKGTTITHKKDETLLYKQIKDSVEHFRKMSKMADDSRIKSSKKKEKSLILPPKTKKMLLGGVAPFTIFKPVAIGGGTSTQTSSTGSSSSKSSKEDKDEKLEFVKDLYKQLIGSGKGIPIDVSLVANNIQKSIEAATLLGENMTTQELSSMYLSAAQLLSQLAYSNKILEDATEKATAKDALSEYAVTIDGKYITQNKEGKLIRASLEQIKKGGLTPLTNNQLLWLRNNDPNMALNRGDSILQEVVANGIGMSKINTEILLYISTIGTDEIIKEGYTKLQANQILLGLEVLRNAPEGDYKYTITDKNLLNQAELALLFVLKALSKNRRAILEINALENGLTPELYVGSIIKSRISNTLKLEFDAVTGKAAKDANGNSKDSEEKIKSNPLMQLIQGEGGVPRTWNLITKDSNVKMSVNGIEYSLLPKITEDMSLDKMLSESGIAGILDSKQGITFGDQNISPDLLKDIMYSNSGGMVVTLPCKIVNGHKEVNLGVKKTYEEAVQDVESKGINKNSKEYYKLLGEVLKQKGLNSLLDSNGYPDRNKFGQFLVVEAYTTDKIKNLDTSSQYIEKVKNPDALLEERMIKALSTDSKKSNYSLDIDYWLWGDDVYRGTVFIPLSNNLNAAINVSGDLISVENARELENKFQNFNKASNMKSSNSDVL